MEKDDIVQTVNLKTGEVKDGYFVYVAYPKAKIRNKRWMMTFQDSLEIIAMDEDMTGQTLKVMLLLMGNLEFENYITIKQVAIAEKLKMQKTHVSRAMKQLVSKGIILKVKEGTTTGYKLNPTYGWKGKVSNMENEQNRLLEKKIIDLDKERELRNPTPPEAINIIDIPPDEIPY
jgi:predicted transcriptional regulator